MFNEIMACVDKILNDMNGVDAHQYVAIGLACRGDRLWFVAVFSQFS